MLPEIGSNFWEFDTSSYRTWDLWWENGSYNIKWLKSGRNAMRAIANLLESQVSVKDIIVPAYLCETEIDPWRENGWNILFYQINDDFGIADNSLKETISDNKPGVILVQSYYGFNTISPKISSILAKAKEDGCIIVEDLTHSIFTEYRLDFADYYTSSLRKFMAIPDGGVVISKEPINNIIVRDDDNRIDEVALEAFEIKKNYLQTLKKDEKATFRGLYAHLAELIGIDDQIYRISKMSYQIMMTCDLPTIKVKRNRNYAYLSGELIKCKTIRLPLKENTKSDCPLYLPVFFESEYDRNDCRDFLAKQDIYCPIIWQKPKNFTIQHDPSKKIYETILCFPIDQRYGLDDMQRIVDTFMQWEEKV